jgi:single-stranded-DNA-specific exonuclease
VLVTVDNGIASLAGVAHARALGLQVLVTDHHLPAPATGRHGAAARGRRHRQPEPAGLQLCQQVAGRRGRDVLRAAGHARRMRERGVFDGLAAAAGRLLDLVALGTVADVVKLDANNRRLVAQGLKRVRSGRMQPGVAALFAVAGRDPARAAGFDFGFALGPRINAAGRLADMTLGIECLRTDDAARAADLAQQLDAINRERRERRRRHARLAEQTLQRLAPSPAAPPPAVTLFDESFHEGVVGIVAGRVKDRLHRPTFVFARGADGQLKGSGRSIPGFHLRDALDLVAKRQPGLLQRFGGHAMAAGCTLGEAARTPMPRGRPWRTFARWRAVADEWLDAATLTRTLRTDGPLPLEWFNPRRALLDAQVWGQGFEPRCSATRCRCCSSAWWARST